MPSANAYAQHGDDVQSVYSRLTTQSSKIRRSSRPQALPFVLASHSDEDFYFDTKLEQVEATTFHGKPAHQLALKVDLMRPFEVSKRIRSATISVRIRPRNSSEPVPVIVGVTPDASLVDVADHEVTSGQTLGVSAGTPSSAAGAVNLSGNFSWGDKVSFKGKRLIHGFVRGDEAHWQMYEEPRSKSGLPPSVRLLMIVEGTGKFVVTADASVQRWSGWGSLGMVKTVSARKPGENIATYVVRPEKEQGPSDLALQIHDDVNTFITDSEGQMKILEGIIDQVFPNLNWDSVYGGAAPVLALKPLNGSFRESKQINVPLFPEKATVGGSRDVKRTNAIFDSGALSQRHAEVWADEKGKVFLRDNKSTCGTAVNKKYLKPDQIVELHVGDLLHFGVKSRKVDTKTLDNQPGRRQPPPPRPHDPIHAKVTYVGCPTSSDNTLRREWFALPSSNNQSESMVARRTRIKSEVDARFDPWTTTASTPAHHQVLGILRSIVERRIGELALDQPPFDPDEDFGGIDAEMWRRKEAEVKAKARQRERIFQEHMYHDDDDDMYDEDYQMKRERMRPYGGRQPPQLFSWKKPTGEELLKRHQAVGSGFKEAKLS